MTGTQDEPLDRDESAPEAPPLPQPVEDDEQAGPVTLVPGPAAQDSPGWRPDRRGGDGGYAVERGVIHPAPSTAAGDHDHSINGFFSSVRRTGRWQVPDRLTLTQGCSEVALDFREAVVRSPVVELAFYGGFSECVIIVPPGVQVEWAGGTAIFSEEKDERRGEADPQMWRLRITHQGVFNEIRVRTLAIGEKEPKWWKKLGLG